VMLQEVVEEAVVDLAPAASKCAEHEPQPPADPLAVRMLAGYRALMSASATPSVRGLQKYTN
jgi:hypothetical protein